MYFCASVTTAVRQSPSPCSTLPSPGISSGPAGTCGSKSGLGLGEGLAEGLGLGDALGDALGLGDGLGLADGPGDGDADDSATGVPVRGVLRMPGVAAGAPVSGAAEGVTLGLAAGAAPGEATGEAAGDAAALACGAGAGEAEGATDGATAGAVEGFGATVGATVATLVGATAGFAGAVVAVGSAWVSTTGVATVRVGRAATGAAVAVCVVAVVSEAALACRVGVNGLKSMASTATATKKRESTIILLFLRLGTCAGPYRCHSPLAFGYNPPTRNPTRSVLVMCRSSGHPTIRHAPVLLAACSTNYPVGQV